MAWYMLLKEHAIHQEVFIYSPPPPHKKHITIWFSEESLSTIGRSLCAFDHVKLSLILQLIDLRKEV